ncbi:DUF1947 domain-containing protein [Candidatus Bathyarchaeota archaeon]|nr:DUF1947 domain-containing protein [Candidatus Bathyarchaeota archaeon]
MQIYMCCCQNSKIMSTSTRRVPLRKDGRKQFLEKVSSNLGLNIESFFGSKPQVEVTETSKGKIYVVNGRPIFAEFENDLFPTLSFEQYVSRLPKVVVDMGAVLYICNGADVMGPGIVGIQGEFAPKSVVTVVDVKNKKPIAIAKSVFDSKTALIIKKGKLFENMHFVGDEIWTVSKEIEGKQKS